jgi:hypothetical protein
VTSVGFCFFEKRKRLKEEHKGKSGRELGQLRKDGVELNEEVPTTTSPIQTAFHFPSSSSSSSSYLPQVDLPVLAFLGDTTGKVLVDHGKLLRYIVEIFMNHLHKWSLTQGGVAACSTYPVVFIECTFFHPDHKEAAAGSLHLHWSDLRPFVLEHRDTTFVLIHFSKRYADEEIHAFFDNERKTQREKEEADDPPGEGEPATPAGNSTRKPAFENVVVWLAGLSSATSSN